MSTTPSKGIIQPYLCFDGRCEEAVEFYEKAIGAERIMLLRFKDSPEPPGPGCAAPGSENKVMHTQFRIGETVVMAGDGPCKGAPVFQGVWLSLIVPTEAEADRYFGGLAEGGEIQMPPTKTFFSPRFGMVKDRFGLSWMILVGGGVPDHGQA